MIVLSCFDGISCGRFSLNKANIPVSTYYASEIDKHAIKVAQHNHPDNVHIGDVRAVRQMCELGMFDHVDMLIGGSPCQALSFAGKQAGLSTKEGIEITTLEQYKQLVADGFEFEGQSYLFWEYVWIRELVRPTWWLLENVRMSKKWLKVFNDIMGVEGVLINSALVSAQNRQRYYWCNWPVTQPEDRGILLRDVIDWSVQDAQGDSWHQWWGKNSEYQLKKAYSAIAEPEGKAICMTARQYACWNGNFVPVKRQLEGVAITPNGIRPYKNDGRKGSFSEIGTIATPNHKSQCVTVAHVPKIAGCRMLGRKLNPETGQRDDYNPELVAQQRIETREDGKVGCITTVSKDSMVATHSVKQINPDKSCAGNQPHMQDRVYRPDGKSVAVTSSFGNRINVGETHITYRKLTVTECCRLQGLPDHYCSPVSNSQAYKALGNGRQCDTIIHLWECLKEWQSIVGVK